MSSVTPEAVERLRESNEAKREKLASIEAERQGKEAQVTLELEYEQHQREAANLDAQIAEAERANKITEMRSSTPNLDGPDPNAVLPGGLSLPEGADGTDASSTDDPSTQASEGKTSRRTSGGSK